MTNIVNTVLELNHLITFVTNTINERKKGSNEKEKFNFVKDFKMLSLVDIRDFKSNFCNCNFLVRQDRLA